MDDPRTDREWAEWIVQTCLMFGTTVATAYQVAGLFIDAIQPTPDDGLPPQEE